MLVTEGEYLRKRINFLSMWNIKHWKVIFFFVRVWDSPGSLNKNVIIILSWLLKKDKGWEIYAHLEFQNL